MRVILPDLSGGFQSTVKVIAGGFLAQASGESIEPQSMASSQRATTYPDQMEELLFAWKVAKHVKSNAIVVTRDRTWELEPVR